MLTNKFCYVYSRYVIRSIFKVTILNIQMPQFSNPYFFSALNSVSDVPASKIFLIYDYPWRIGGSYNSTYTKSGLPYRQSYKQGITQTGKSVILISYTLTSSEVAFWRRLQSVGNTISKRFDETRVTDGIVKVTRSSTVIQGVHHTCQNYSLSNLSGTNTLILADR